MLQKAAWLPGVGALLGGPWCILPQLDSAPPSGFQVQPPVCKKHLTLVGNLRSPQAYFEKRIDPPPRPPPSRTLLAVGLKVGEGRMVESCMWLWKATCYF